MALQTQALNNILSKKASPGTYSAMQKKASSVTVVTHISRATSNTSTGAALKLERVTPAHLAAEQKTAVQYHDFSQHRMQAEAAIDGFRSDRFSPSGPQVANQGHPAANPPGKTVAVAHSIKLQLPQEIVKASSATSTATGAAGSIARTKPPQPSIPKPQPHGEAGKPSK